MFRHVQYHSNSSLDSSKPHSEMSTKFLEHSKNCSDFSKQFNGGVYMLKRRCQVSDHFSKQLLAVEALLGKLVLVIPGKNCLITKTLRHFNDISKTILDASQKCLEVSKNPLENN